MWQERTARRPHSRTLPAKGGDIQKPLTPSVRAPRSPWARKKPTFELNIAQGPHCFNLPLGRLKPTPNLVGWGQGVSHLWLIRREVFPNCKDPQWNQIGKSPVTEIQTWFEVCKGTGKPVFSEIHYAPHTMLTPLHGCIIWWLHYSVVMLFNSEGGNRSLNSIRKNFFKKCRLPQR